MAVATQIETAKDRIRVFLSSYFDGYNHTVSGAVVEFPDCYVRMFFTSLPEGPDKSLDKPLITVLLAPGADQRGQWVTDTDSGASAIFLTWAKSPDDDIVGYFVYRSATEIGGYVKVSDLLTGLSYVDTPSAGSYWYQVVTVDDEDTEVDWEGPTNLVSSAIVFPKITKANELLFHIFVAATLSQGGQRIVDNVSSLLLALFNSSQTAYLKEIGLRFPAITTPASLRPEEDLWASSMFLKFETTVEYG